MSEPQPCSSSSSSSTGAPEVSRQKDKPKGEIRSHVEFLGSGISSCGYCKGGERASHDMLGLALLPCDYQALLDKGWRRSGKYCYRPINQDTCCPNYPISCKATKFRLSRSQRLCIQRMNAFLMTGSKSGGCSNSIYKSKQTVPPMSSKTLSDLRTSKKSRHRRWLATCERKAKLHNITLEEAFQATRLKYCQSLPPITDHTLEDYLFPLASPSDTENSPVEPKHQLTIELMHVRSPESQAIQDEEVETLRKYQRAVHKEGPEKWTLNRYREFLVESPLLEEKIKDRLYCLDSEIKCDKLVADVNQDLNQYLLVKPPPLPMFYGTYHCIYRLDGQLIAVGVLDVLPKCLTTVYFFYNPDFGYLNLGTYSALIEISMVRRMHEHFTGCDLKQDPFKHYYLGFYVHECPKMHYKTTFKPSYLLCSETCKYVPTHDCLSKLRRGVIKYARFSPTSPNTFDGLNGTYSDFQSLPLLTPIDIWSLTEYLFWLTENLGRSYCEKFLDEYIMPYVRFVGLDLAHKLVFRIRHVHMDLVEDRCEAKNAANTGTQQSKHSAAPSKFASSISGAIVDCLARRARTKS